MKKRKIIFGILATVLIVASLGTGFLLLHPNTEVPSAKAAENDSVAKITFTTDANYPFENGETTINYTTEKEAIETMALPMFQSNPSYTFVGWQLTNKFIASTTLHPNDLEVNQVYEPYELLRKGFYAGDEFTFKAIYKEQTSIDAGEMFESKATVTDRTPSIGHLNLPSGNVYVYPNPDPTSEEVTATFASSSDGFKEALYAIYEANNPEIDYVIYVGGTVSGMRNHSIGDKTTTVTGPSDVTFYSLSGRAKSLTITGKSDDPINYDSPRSATGLTRLDLPTTTHFGTDIEIRNINYRFVTTMAAHGNALYLGGGNYSTSAQTIYGGSSDNETVTKKTNKQATILIGSTGLGTWELYGGNANGEFIGDTNVALISSNSTTYRNLTGGNDNGTVKGNTNLSVYGAGTITNFYGGSLNSNVTGNVNNIVRSSDGNLSTTNYYGGVKSGNIDGSVTNFVAGAGGTGTGVGAYWYGGSESGNIGTAGAGNFVQNVLDSSQWSSGNFHFVGGNKSGGIITGDITNTVRADASTNGRIRSVNAGIGAQGSSVGSSIADLNYLDDLGTAEERAKHIKAHASQQVIGNLDTHILGGSVSAGGEAGYARAAGMKGYFEGDTLITVGILKNDDSRAGGYNFAYAATSQTHFNNDNLAYQVSSRYDSPSANRTETSGWDIFGGTGRSGSYSEANTGYVKGNTNTVINNALARWTYGAGFNGVIDGNTSHTLNGGLVDTLEGGGYMTQRIYGDTKATMLNGEVNFFFSGGGWSDAEIHGNVSAHASGGFINAPIGGTFGYDTNHTVRGNSDVTITGGNLSGILHPSHWDGSAKTLRVSGGATKAGHIMGDTTLTLDLRNATDFQLPTTSISAGKPYDGYSGSRLGTPENPSTVTLNIYTSHGSDILNNAQIYGDGGNVNDSHIKEMNINIDAPGSTIGNIYATEYNGLTATNDNGYLRSDVNINVLRADSIGGLSGTSANGNDSLTNQRVANSAERQRAVDVKLGVELPPNPSPNSDYAVTIEEVHRQSEEILAENPDARPYDIAFSGLGLVNFTSLEVANGFNALANGGDIANGRQATTNTHYNQFDKFGDVVIHDGSGFGVTTENSSIFLGGMTINGASSVYSSPGEGKINLASLTMADEKANLIWRKQADGDSTVASVGNYFGETNAYRVLTFSASDANGNRVMGIGEDLTPANFNGVEDATGKSFVGDVDMSSTQTGADAYREYGIMIPGSVIDFKVAGDYDPEDLSKLLSAGHGLISHDVTQAQTNMEHPPMLAYATVAADTGVTSGRLVVPITDEAIYPTLTFDPDDPTGSWLRKGTIQSTKVDGSFDETIEEQEIGDFSDITWKLGENTAPDANEYSYDITIVFSNEIELAGKNVIITDSQAKEIDTNEKVLEMLAVKGRPFLTSNLTEEQVAEISAGLSEDQVKKVHPVEYRVRDHEDEGSVVNERQGTYNLVVVPDEAVVAEAQDFALYAKDASITMAQGRNLSGQPELDQETAATVIYADGTEDQPADLAESYLEEIRSKTMPTEVPIIYTATYGDGDDAVTIEKPVTITITGAIYLSQITDSFDFGTQEVTFGETSIYWPERIAHDESKDPEGKRGWTDIVVTDTRGDNVEWELSVRETLFLTDPETNRRLEGVLYFTDTETGIDHPLSDVSFNLMKASNGEYGSTYEENYIVTSSWKNDTKGIRMMVPPSHQVVGTYEGELEWELTYAP